MKPIIINNKINKLNFKMSAYKSQINKGTRNLILPKIQSNQTAQISQKNLISLVSQIKILT